jgi:hypothetical protein
MMQWHRSTTTSNLLFKSTSLLALASGCSVFHCLDAALYSTQCATTAEQQQWH